MQEHWKTPVRSAFLNKACDKIINDGKLLQIELSDRVTEIKSACFNIRIKVNESNSVFCME